MLSGLVAALGFKHAKERFPLVSRIGAYAPWLSVSLLLVMGSLLVFH
jgi:hypothetical protein